MIREFKEQTLYELKEPHDDERPEFRFALSTEGVGGCWLADCWIVNEKGKRHPGYDACPVPVRADSLKREVGPMACGFKAQSVFDGPWFRR